MSGKEARKTNIETEMQRQKDRYTFRQVIQADGQRKAVTKKYLKPFESY